MRTKILLSNIVIKQPAEKTYLFVMFVVLLCCSIPNVSFAEGKHQKSKMGNENRQRTQNKKSKQNSVGNHVIETVSVSGSRLSGVHGKLATIPGGTSIIDAKRVLQSRNFTNADVLAFQPGVFAQSAGGGDGLHLSIRGSGIQTGTNYYMAGVDFFLDGLPISSGAGTPYDFFEPLGQRYTEVLRGANGFDYGGLQLGGTINYVSNTGYEQPHWQARVEAGSFNYNKEQISSARVVGKWDYYISVTKSYRGGYQDQTTANTFGISANAGYRFNDNIDTRVYFRYRQMTNGYPGYLTRSQILHNPKQAQSPYGLSTNERIQPGSKYYGDMTNIRIDDKSNIHLGFNYQDAPINSQQGSIASIWGVKAVGGVLNYERRDSLFGHKTNTKFGITSVTDLEDWDTRRVHFQTGTRANLPIGTLLRHSTYDGMDNVFHLSNTTEIAHNFWLTSAGALSYTERGAHVTWPTGGGSVFTSSINFMPRGGFRYIVIPGIEVYGNVSRSFQPPQDWNLLYAGTYYPNSSIQSGLNNAPRRLRNQTATTFEIGTQGDVWHNHWSITYYHSSVHNELLSVSTPELLALGETIYGNASPTVHQGVEVSLETNLAKWNGNILSLRQAYTYQNFRFKHDSTFGNNRLPGIPEHFYQGAIHLDTHVGFYAEFNAQVSSKVGASYDETYFAPSYHIFNALIGYNWPNKNRRIFLSINNLANKHYAAIVVPGYQSKGTELSVMQPGDGFGLFGGVSFGFD